MRSFDKSNQNDNLPGQSEHYCTVLGGPNGSGKSTIFQYLRPPGEFINADVVAKRLSSSDPASVSLAAGREVLRWLDATLSSRQDFVYETTLSSFQSLNIMSRSRAAGFEVSLVFVTLNSADLNVRRVAERVASGGHDIPEKVVRRRYESSFSRLPEAIRLADRVLLFDNSSIDPVMLMSIEFGQVIENHFDTESQLHRRLAEAVGSGLGCNPSTLLNNLPLQTKRDREMPG